MPLTPEQIKEVRASAGFSPTPPVEGEVDRLSQLKELKQSKETRSLAGEILPIGGGIIGGLGGAALGGIAGGPAGAWAGGAAGAGLGAAAGETAQQALEKATGRRKEFAPEEIAKVGAEMGAIEAIGGPVLNVAGKVLKGAGEVIAKSMIPTSIKEAGLLQSYKAGNSLFSRFLSKIGLGEAIKQPTTAAGTAFEKGLIGTEAMMGVQAKKEANGLWKNLIAPQLEKSEVKVNMPTFFSELEQNIIKSNPEKARQSDLLSALSSLKDDYAGVTEIGLGDLQKFKEGWAKFVPEKAYRGKPIAGAFNDLKDEAADLARTKIYDALGDEVKQAYFDYGNLKALQELGKQAMTGKVKGGTGTTLKNIMETLLVPVTTIGGQTTYKVGQGVEFVGKPGARYLRDLFEAVPEAGKVLNPAAAPTMEDQ